MPNSNDPVSQLEKHLLRASDDSARLKAYREFLPYIVPVAPVEAIRLASRASLIAHSIGDVKTQLEISRHLVNAYLQTRDHARALHELNNAQDLVRDQESLSEFAWIFTDTARAYRILAEPAKAFDWHERALAASPPGATPARADVLEAFADFYSWMGRYDEAIGVLREVLAIWEELNDQAGIGRALCEIGTGYGLMEDLATAYDYYQRSLAPFQNAGDFVHMARALANMSSIHQSRGELSAAIETAWRAHAACEEHEDWATSASLTITIATMHWQQGEPDLALNYYVKAFDLLQKHPDDNLLLVLYQRVGGLHQETGDLDAAKHVYTQALKIADHLKELQAQMELQKALSQVYERQGSYREALGHYRQFAGLQSRLANEEQRQTTAEMQMKHTITELAKKLEQAQQQIRGLQEDNDSLQRKLIRDGVNRTEESTKRKKEGLPSKEESDSKGGKDGNDDMKNETPDGETSASTPDDEWARLEHEFEKAHPNFKKALLELCPEITPTEIKICILTKILGDKSQKIAKVLGNHIRTLQTQRHNIRKKLGLAKDVNFVTYIQAL